MCRDKVFGLEIRASFESETLSLTMPIRSLIFVMITIDQPQMNLKKLWRFLKGEKERIDTLVYNNVSKNRCINKMSLKEKIFVLSKTSNKVNFAIKLKKPD